MYTLKQVIWVHVIDGLTRKISQLYIVTNDVRAHSRERVFSGIPEIMSRCRWLWSLWTFSFEFLMKNEPPVCTCPRPWSITIDIVPLLTHVYAHLVCITICIYIVPLLTHVSSHLLCITIHIEPLLTHVSSHLVCITIYIATLRTHVSSHFVCTTIYIVPAAHHAYPHS